MVAGSRLFVFRRTLSRNYFQDPCSLHQKNVNYNILYPSKATYSQHLRCIHNHCNTLLPGTETSFANEKDHGYSKLRKFSKYASPSKFNFDTHMMVTDFQRSGFSQDQAEVVTSAIADVVHSTVGNLEGHSVSRVEQEQLEIRLKSLIEKVRSDMIILEKTEFVRMKTECEKLQNEVDTLRHLLQEEVVKLKSNQALDVSLERSRVKEEFQFRDQKIKDNHNRIDTEVARVETKIEAQKLDLLKYLVGSVLSMCTIILAFWRFFKM